jgi:hypothetical protein
MLPVVFTPAARVPEGRIGLVDQLRSALGFAASADPFVGMILLHQSAIRGFDHLRFRALGKAKYVVVVHSYALAGA